ncbi:MAG: glutathione binding-like protein, partial [Pseudomonadota bacterium]
VEVERVELDIMGGEHKSPEHLAKAGSFHVPLLELSDGTFLTESVAICRYLEALYPEPNLCGVDAREAATIEMWERRMEHSLLFTTAGVVRHAIPAMQALERVQVPEWGEACRPRVVSSMKYLNKRLQESAYIAGDRFTIADITAMVAMGLMRVIKQDVPEGCDALAAWWEKMKERPSSRA